MAGGNALHIEAATRLQLEQAFTFLAYELDLAISKRNPDTT